ncbi:phosphodiester glycosidase family protein [candidate division KSB1 bacterium]|nr:phosphodiester glycosidase family protein [candidate division KSB1 bacterium]
MDIIKYLKILCIFLFSLLQNSCFKTGDEKGFIPMNWQPVDSINVNLPEGIKLFAGENDTLPLRAWYVLVDEGRKEIQTEVVVSDDTTDNRETVSSFANDLGACLVVNGGYFTMKKTPADHVGLLYIDGEMIASATNKVKRDTINYQIARAAIGFTAEDKIDVSWITSRNDTIFFLDKPFENSPNQPVQNLDYNQSQVWKVEDGLSAGPNLISDGKINITSDQELFFGTSIPKIHPRTAAGYTKDGKLILMVVDGRQDKSRGVNLQELALLLLDLGCVEALNLDGGGSSTLVVNNQLINLPAGKNIQREVMSVIAVFCK